MFEENQPIFGAMGKSILHVGELGNAKMVKNAMAMFAAVQHMSLIEICSWLKKLAEICVFFDIGWIRALIITLNVVIGTEIDTHSTAVEHFKTT